MPGRLTTIEDLQGYLAGVVERADHHAGEVGEIVFAVAGAIVLFKDPDTEIKVMVKHGETKNVLWVYIGGSRYAFSYNHIDRQVEVREGSVQGPTLVAITNATPIREVIALFSRLKRGLAAV